MIYGDIWKFSDSHGSAGVVSQLTSVSFIHKAVLEGQAKEWSSKTVCFLVTSELKEIVTTYSLLTVENNYDSDGELFLLRCYM